MTQPSSSKELVSLSDSLDPLKAAFNAAQGIPRLVCVVSPTCNLCVQGAGAAFEILGKVDPQSPLAAFMIWIDMLASDNGEEARRRTESMQDPRIVHFHDGAKRAGTAFAQAMGGRRRPAWDIYMVFPSGISWEEPAPRPRTWVHQNSLEMLANPLRFRTGGMLKRELFRLINASLKANRKS